LTLQTTYIGVSDLVGIMLITSLMLALAAIAWAAVSDNRTKNHENDASK